jgi:hypothetical protein
MSTVIFAGLPQRYLPTLRSLVERQSDRFPLWNFKYVPTLERSPSLRPRDVSQIERVAATSDRVHVLGMPDDKNGHAGAAAIRPFFRFRWFPHGLLHLIGSPDPERFISELVAAIEEEEDWAKRVMPQNHNSALLLPETCFTCSARNRDMWRHALAYGDPNNLTGAENAISQFSRTHRQHVIFSGHPSYKWVDDSERIYDEDGQRHGDAPPPRMWKYSYKIEDGFHYDLTHLRNRKFSLHDALGIEHRAKADSHINVDIHGYVR